MKHLTTLLAALLLVPSAALHAADRKLNVVLFLMDDMGYWLITGRISTDLKLNRNQK